MKRISEYWEFIIENKIELLVLESKLEMSDEFKLIIKEIMSNYGNVIATILLDIYEMNKNKYYNPLFDFNLKDNFIDVSISNDKATFTTDSKGQKSDSPYSENRNEIKIGRLVRKILGTIKNTKIDNVDSFRETIFKKILRMIDNVKDSDIEEFVNKYKASYDRMRGAMERFEVVYGNDIVKWYGWENYDKVSGELGNSCMRYEKCSPYINFYADNNNIKLLILLNENKNKIIGRALIWENVYIGNGMSISVLDNVDMNKTFMDRIYTINNSDVNLFIKYAKSNNFYYKKTQDSHPETDILSPSGEENSTIIGKINSDQGPYPYTDTLKYYYWENGIISNMEISDNYYINLSDTKGNYYCENCGGDGYQDCEDCYGDGYQDCEDCGGHGTNECDTCGGSGEIVSKDGDGVITKDCEDCKGDGQLNCETCDGDGRLECETCIGNGSKKCETCGDPQERYY